MLKRELLEKDIEKYLNLRARATGYSSFKFVSPQRRSVPDRIFLGSIENVIEIIRNCRSALSERELAEAVMREAILFIECKRPGGKPTEAQEREHAKLRARGFTVLIVDSREQIDTLYPKDTDSLM